jgi:hypothetical protein
VSVSIATWLEGEMGKTVEEFWKTQRALATNLASQRVRAEGIQQTNPDSSQLFIAFDPEVHNTDGYVFED